jgi:hypothetical protein
LKVQEFSLVDAAFKDTTCYCDWQFLYLPPRRNFYRAPVVAPGTPSPAPTPAPGTSPGPVLHLPR